MVQKNKNYFDLIKLQALAIKLSLELKSGSLILLKGELGAGKTTFARFLINNLYELNNLKAPNSIKSPSFPILLTYFIGPVGLIVYWFIRIFFGKKITLYD